jgi:glycosyltransferase involved in cell wall biosynthesis
MHIVHLIARPNDGGPVRVLAELGRALAARGHRATVLCGACADDEPDRADLLTAAGLAVERVPGLGRAVAPWRDARALAALPARLAALAPDVIHTHTAKAGALGRLAARCAHRPCLHTFHGHVLRGHLPRWGERLARHAEALLAGTHHLHAPTPTLVRDLAARFRLGRPARWHALPVPVPPMAVARTPRPERARVLFLGRLAPVKDAALFLDVLRLVARALPAQGIVCGDGPERAAVTGRAAALGCPVALRGFVPAAAALAEADVLVLTSRHEGQPLTVVEAAAAGVPVVAPPVGGLADLCRWGLAWPAARNAPALAAATLHALAHGPRPRAAAVAASLTGPALAARWEALYRAVACTRC